MSEPTQDPSPASAIADEELLGRLADDFAVRRRRGEHPTVEEYLAKYPPLAERIHKVLSAVGMIEQTVPLDLTPGERPGSTVGRYKLLERIGEGGFGVVYMAEQLTPVRRKVALKIVKPGMDSRQVLARFEAERQALAIMDHPNIAKVFDGGMTDFGRPYFVMELVKGDPITEFCDQHQLTPRQRLELFAQVCHAVQHAHQKGIIHRDIKPSNVLVSMHDTAPVVKVIDFGVAKALGQELTERTLFTGFAQLLGTPLYMSPEQAGQSSLDVDTRSDIYSLGVLLYELLTGTTPFDKERFRTAAQDEICRIIREEEPPRPSTRLTSTVELPSIAAQRGLEPKSLSGIIRGELDWIVMKALEKDRGRRYETASGLARDIERYMGDEPVAACPPSSAYRLKKFVRRNKGTLVTASLIGVTLLVAVGSLGWMVRDRSARHARVAARVEQILSEADDLGRQRNWAAALDAARRAEAAVNSAEADAATVRHVRGRLRDLEFIDQLEQIRLLRSVWIDGHFDAAGADRAYARAFRDYGVDIDQLGAQTSIERLAARPLLAVPVAVALDDWVAVRPRGSGRSQELSAVARAVDPEPLRNRLRAYSGAPTTAVRDELRRLADSIDLGTQPPETLISLARKLGNPETAARLLRDAQRVYPGDFWLNFELAEHLRRQKDYEGAVRFYTAAVSIRPQATAALNNLGLNLRDQGKLDEAVFLFRKAIERDPKFGIGYSNLSLVLRAQGKKDEAAAAFQRSIELDARQGYHALGHVLLDEGKASEAVAAFRKASELDPTWAVPHVDLGRAMHRLKKRDEATASFQRALELEPTSASAFLGLGQLLHWRDDDKAIEYYRKAIEFDPTGHQAYENMGGSLSRRGKLDEAIASLEEAMRLDPKCATARSLMASLLASHPDPARRDPQRALELARFAVERQPSATHWQTLGWALYRAGDVEGCVAALQKSMALQDSPKGGDAGQWFCLSLAHWKLGNQDEARQWYDRGVAWMEKSKWNNADINCFRREAAELLGVHEKK